MRSAVTNTDPTQIALNALVWTLGDEDRAQRLLDTTGLTPDDLRARASEPAVLSAVLGFLENYEPDLLACAEGIGERPEAIVAARAALDPEYYE
ncbi:DUF3572 family protein [Sphingomonas sp. AAP5]|uniref:DUF3572 family protein n=1 Tax=Sphingomonas glacialis TaxID=658225 RepID=A0ABQ3LP20_9SPHN|nr:MULTISPECIES: DUF3572 domain-containing protein [Sphingomonas]QBM77434.1 DUF3572 family protein [Sphingomonas sp. AAP5]GHH22195.1 hypothetical protein GCM10008023_31970 [Sphingomonas glacialis]